MKIINRICIVVCLLIIVLVLTYNMILVQVPLGSVGVMTQQYALPGSEKGVKTKDFGPGWHLDLGPIHKWVTFDATTQTLEMTRDPSRGSVRGRDDVQLKSADGNSISLDMTVKYKIMPGSAYLLYKNLGGESAYKQQVRDLATDTFRNIYGHMNTEEFYNPEVRAQRTKEAFISLKEVVGRIHVELIEVLVRDVQFEAAYEQKILMKKLADQDVELNKSQSIAAEKRGETMEIEADAVATVKVIGRERDGEILKMRAETEKTVAQISAEAEKFATENRADADLYAAQLVAKGTLLVREAEAEGERLKAAALVGNGGRNLVALEGARNISLADMTISTVETDFLDVAKMVRMFGATGD